MTRFTDGTTEIELENFGKEILVTLEASQYKLKELAQFTSFLQKTDLFLEGQVRSATEEKLELIYPLPEYAESIFQAIFRSDNLERLEIARKFSVLADWQKRTTCGFLHPENLFLVSGQLQVVHRGALGLVEPSFKDNTRFLLGYKALILSTIQPKYRYESLVAGKIAVRDAFSKEIFEASTVEEINQILDKQYQALRLTRQANQRLVKKTWYSTFKWAAIIFALISLGLGIWLGISLESTIPKQSRIIDSQTAFITNNFDQATKLLEQDTPQSLPKSAQYVLAVSYVHLENLTNEQKNAILNNLSLNSSDNELLYWTYIGRGQFNDGLSIAQNIGDNQLILHAYTKLYDATQADTKMSGSKKQELLNQYKEKIGEYVKLLGGKATNGQ
jgi:type VII secretion protein EssB